MDDEMNGATFPTKADRLFGPNPSGLDEYIGKPVEPNFMIYSPPKSSST